MPWHFLAPMRRNFNARWGHDGVEQIKFWTHQRFVEAWAHDFSNYLISIGGEDEF
jgi:hypothetical protein